MTAGRRTVCLVGSGERVVRAAQQHGFDVVLIAARTPLKTAAIQLAEHTVVCDYTDPAELTALLRAVHAWRPFERLASLAELGQVPAAVAAAALGVPGPDPRATRLARDKLAMRETLRTSGLPHTRYARCASPTELVTFGAEAGWPVVLKVVDGVGKDGVRLVGSPRAAPEAFAAVAAAVPGRALMVEEYHPGPEVSVETLSYDGRHHVLAVTDKESNAPYLNETGHTIPSRLDPVTLAAVRRTTVDLLDLLGVRTALCHTELRCTPAGPRVIETHTRPGGDHIRDLLRLAYGIDIYDMFFGLLAGAEVELPGEPRGAAAIRFLTPVPGRVVGVHGVGLAEQMPGVVEVDITVEPGDLAPEPTGNHSRCGYVIAVGRTADEAAAAADTARAAIQVSTTGARQGDTADVRQGDIADVRQGDVATTQVRTLSTVDGTRTGR
ncbi:MAG TPA: ATP-grasp domain-containing protein [Mycobacteriales bacterium]|nr:ATP-grasp domain-containing protein [Mycobacteriales bacterium]